MYYVGMDMWGLCTWCHACKLHKVWMQLVLGWARIQRVAHLWVLAIQFAHGLLGCVKDVYSR